MKSQMVSPARKKSFWYFPTILITIHTKHLVVLAYSYYNNTSSSLPDVALLDEDTCMMDGLSQPKLEDLCLQAAFQKVLILQTQHVIKLHAGFLQDTSTNQTTKQSIT